MNPKETNVEKIFSAIHESIKKFMESHSDSTLFEELKNSGLQKCRFCFESGEKNFYICGHNYCSNCLYSKTKDFCSRGETIVCECKTPISFIDIKSCFSTYEDLNETIQSAVSYYLTNNPTSKFTICPIEDCSFLRQKSLGYSECPGCKVFSCPLCRSINEIGHSGVSCKEYQENPVLNIIFNRAIQFLKEKWNTIDLGKYSFFEKNPGLELRCPSMQKFTAAINKLGSSYLHSGFFAWHGTPSEGAVTGICHEGFDPKKRSGQAYGPGEYFGQSATVSHDYAKSSGRMLVCYLLKVSEVSMHGNFCYIVKNPTDSSLAYNLPVLVVTYGNNSLKPLDFITPPPNIDPSKTKPKLIDFDWESSTIKAFRWHWKNDDDEFMPYMDSINILLENKYEEFIHHGGERKFKTPPIIRYVDDRPQEYLIDFKKDLQINCKTEYERKIKRVKTDIIINRRSKWIYENDDGSPQDFEILITNDIEKAFRNYLENNGSAYLKNLSFPGRPETYTIDFIEMRQINEKNGNSRFIKRVEI